MPPLSAQLLPSAAAHTSDVHVPLLQVQGLSFSYPQRRLFGHWSASFASGVTLVCGDEGSGKTTLLRLLAGDLRADGGQLQIGAVRLDQQATAYRAMVFRTEPQSDALDQMTPQAWFDAFFNSAPHLGQKL